MKKSALNSVYFLIAFLCAFSTKSLAQEGVSQLIKSGPADATKLAQAYIAPALKGLGFGLNSGWYNSAQTKNLGRFDIRIVGSGAIVPTSDQSFDIRTVGLSNSTRLRNPNNYETPTAFGKNQQGPELVLYDDQNREVGSFNMPNGLGVHFVPSPQIQLTVGLIKKTDLSIRYSPKIDLSNSGNVQVLGFGVKHEITKLIFGKAAKIIPVDIALAFGWNQIKYNYAFAPADQVDDSNSDRDLHQRIEGSFSGYSFDAILSKKLALFTPFVSVAYNSAQSDIGLLGDYIVNTGYDSSFPPQKTYTTFTDPVKIKQNDIAGLRANVGFQLHLAIFRIYAAYGIGQYSAVTGGIGLGIGH